MLIASLVAGAHVVGALQHAGGTLAVIRVAPELRIVVTG